MVATTSLSGGHHILSGGHQIKNIFCSGTSGDPYVQEVFCYARKKSSTLEVCILNPPQELATLFVHSYREPEVVVRYLDMTKLLYWLC